MSESARAWGGALRTAFRSRIDGHTLLFALTLAATAIVLWRQPPFAFYSPDLSFHAAKTTRAAAGDPYRDPFSGTLSIYPAAFHALFGALNRWVLGWHALELMRLIGVLNWLGLLGGYWWLARVTLGDARRASLSALTLGLLFYAPTGRHVLLANPANFALPLLFCGLAFVSRHLVRPRPLDLALGCFCVASAPAIVWYDLAAAVAVGVALILHRPRRWPWAALAGTLPPVGATLYQLLAVRPVWPCYSAFVGTELGRQGGATGAWPTLTGWLTATLTRGNLRFLALVERSRAAFAQYYLLALPAGLLVLGAAGYLLWRQRRAGRSLDPRARLPLLVALLTLAFSLLLAVTHDWPRVVRVQFVAWACLLLFVIQAVPAERLKGCWGWLLAAAAVFSLGYTVRHSDRRFSSEVPRPTQAVIDFIAALPSREHSRIFVSEANLRRLAPFVAFDSFLNHGDGRYYSQDPVSSAALLAAYRSIFERRQDWPATLAHYQVGYLAFRHGDGGAELEAGRFYLSHGRPVLANREWWVIAAPPAPAGVTPLSIDCR